MNELISVVIPVYNAEKYLDRCVESIVNQTYEHLEIVLVDDGSPDSCPAMCDAWAERDSRVRVIHKSNEGVMYARLDGAQSAAGEYVIFVDSDDWLDLDTCRYLYDILTKNNAQASCIRIQSVNQNCPDKKPDNTDENITIYTFTQMYSHLIDYPFWSICGKLIKRSLFDNVPRIEQRITISEDTMYVYFVFKQIDTVVTSDYKMYYYFNNSNSAIAGEIKYSMIDDSMLAYRIIDDDFDKTSPVYENQVINRIWNDFFLLNSVIRNNKCLDRYDVLRDDIFENIKLVSKENMHLFNTQQKIGLKLLKYCPKLYNQSILIRKKIRGY